MKVCGAPLEEKRDLPDLSTGPAVAQARRARGPEPASLRKHDMEN